MNTPHETDYAGKGIPRSVTLRNPKTGATIVYDWIKDGVEVRKVAPDKFVYLTTPSQKILGTGALIAKYAYICRTADCGANNVREMVAFARAMWPSVSIQIAVSFAEEKAGASQIKKVIGGEKSAPRQGRIPRKNHRKGSVTE